MKVWEEEFNEHENEHYILWSEKTSLEISWVGEKNATKYKYIIFSPRNTNTLFLILTYSNFNSGIAQKQRTQKRKILYCDLSVRSLGKKTLFPYRKNEISLSLDLL